MTQYTQELIYNHRASMPSPHEEQAEDLCGLGTMPPIADGSISHEVYSEEDALWLPVLAIFARRERLGGSRYVTTLYVHTTVGVVVYLAEEEKATHVRPFAEDADARSAKAA